MNPLDTQELFSLELMNPNPTSSKTKDGPKYRVSFEMHKEEWQKFMDANTNGMILEFQGRVTETAKKPIGKIPEKKVKGGPLSVECAMWCQDELPNKYAITEHGYADFQHMVYDQCRIESRRLLDHDETAAYNWNRIKSDFCTWAENRESQ
jgi:hypothetical protein